MKTKKAYSDLQRIVRAFSNHRRIEILDLLDGHSPIDVTGIAQACRINFKTASEHVRRLALGGLVFKKAKGTHVLHTISTRGEKVLKFLRTLE